MTHASPGSPPPSPPSLRLRGLAAAYGGDPRPGAPGVGPIDLEVAPGERLVLVGASGEGKTTLLRAVAGLLPSRAGRVEVGGTDVTSRPPERRGTVYLHQAPVLFPHLSVEANVGFPLRVRGIPRPEARARVDEALASVQLQALASRNPAALSGGQRHRVALARAVVAEPALLLLDEPFSSLDPGLRHEVRDALVRLQDRYRPGVILVTHDLEEAGLLGHRMGIVMEGRIAQLGAPSDLFGRPVSHAVARFLGYRNELSLEADNPLARALASVLRGGDAAAQPLWNAPLDPPEPDASRRVAVLPPGACWIEPRRGGPGDPLVRAAAPDLFAPPPASPPGRDRPADPLVRLPARVRSVHYPGAAPAARIEVDGGTPLSLELAVPPGAGLSAGAEVDLVVDPARVCVFGEPDEGRPGRIPRPGPVSP